MNYKEQYLTPEWKKKRAKILKRDNNSCQHCDSKQNLHVHHKYYNKDVAVWNYANNDLITYCKDCHKELHELWDGISFQIGKYFGNPTHSREVIQLLVMMRDFNPLQISNITKLVKIIRSML